jgi:hypothetical protein
MSIVSNHCLRTQNQRELRVNRGPSRLPRSSTKLVGKTQSSPVSRRRHTNQVIDGVLFLTVAGLNGLRYAFAYEF